MATTKTLTPFEQAVAAVKAGKLTAPSVSYGGKPLNYFGYQISVHHFNLKIMAAGMTCRGIKFTDIKKYYGLKGKSAKDCLPQFVEVINKYNEENGFPALK